jgi:dolichyl-phosphate-mannose--protein O-mannosyl transferase
VIGPAAVPGGILPDRRLVGVVVFALYLAAVAACFVYFYPIYTGEAITYDQWWTRMWLGTRWV